MKWIESQFNKIYLFERNNLMKAIYTSITFQLVIEIESLYEVHGKYTLNTFYPLNKANIKLEIL